MRTPIADTDTLADVLPLLRNPEEQVRQMLESMGTHRARSPVVRIGRRGSGAYPCFRIVAGDGTGEVLGAYNDNGTPFPTAEGSVHWCSGQTDREAVAQLLMQIRNDRKLRSICRQAPPIRHDYDVIATVLSHHYNASVTV